jgi:hypothetical protein
MLTELNPTQQRLFALFNLDRYPPAADQLGNTTRQTRHRF